MEAATEAAGEEMPAEAAPADEAPVEAAGEAAPTEAVPPASGPDVDAIAAALNVSGDRLARLMDALAVAGKRMRPGRAWCACIVAQDPPPGAEKRGEFYFVVDMIPKGGAPARDDKRRDGPRRDRGGPGGGGGGGGGGGRPGGGPGGAKGGKGGGLGGKGGGGGRSDGPPRGAAGGGLERGPGPIAANTAAMVEMAQRVEARGEPR